MKKVIVIGSGGAGKSTFAKRLGQALAIDVIHLDQLYWKPGWVKTPVDEWEKIVERVLAGDSWVIDGNFGGTRELRMRACDTIVFLNIPRYVCLYRVLKRFVWFHGKSRPDMTPGCDEKFDLEFILWVWNYPGRTKFRGIQTLEQFTEKNIVILNSSREVDEYVKQLA